MDLEDPTLFDADPACEDPGNKELAAVVSTLPALRYETTFVEPVRRLNETLSDVLDVETYPERTPAESLSMLKAAMDTFNYESEEWLG